MNIDLLIRKVIKIEDTKIIRFYHEKAFRDLGLKRSVALCH